MNSISSGIVDISSFFLILKLLLLLLAVLYFVFNLIVIRQVSLMTKSLITEISPVISMFALVYAALGLGAVLLFVKLL